MKIPLITPALLRSWKACWGDARITKHLAGRDSATIAQVVADESISLDDRLWVVTRLLAHVDESAARLYAIERALTVTHLTNNNEDQAAFRGIMNDLVCAEDLPAAARSAARSAARDAARDAARSAAWSAAWSAARSAAWEASRDAALRASIIAALEWLGDKTQ